MIKTFEVRLADRRGDRKAHQMIKAESMAEAIVQAEQAHPGLMVNGIEEMRENIYQVEMIFSNGSTRLNNTIKAYSPEDASRIARLRNKYHTVVNVQKIG